ncbi:serine hydrolase [Lewinella sp. LCG006]|uniref:serine hydrolase n=1 Tax=Lewinella sp. LCG006 TaxID=3231911 RepID=UPI00346119B7
MHPRIQNQPYLLSFLLFFATLVTGFTQTTEDWQGKWDGAIELPSTPLALQIKLINTDGTWEGLMDIPSQRINDMALADLKIEGDQLSFKLPEVPGTASFTGSWSPGTVTGTFSQMGQSFPLVLKQQDAAAAAALQAKITRIKNLVDSFRIGAEVPGLGLGIIYKGEVIIADGFGLRNVEDGIAVNADTRFAIGSSSKAFTTMGLALLADEDKLDWETPLKKYLPDFKLYDNFATEEMNAIDLTCHRSGLPRHDLMWYATDFSREELYQRLQYLEPSASFRSKWQYQNLMYMTAGILTERLSGQTWEAYIQEKIFQPLGMSSTSFSVTEMEQTDNFAYGYGKKEEAITRLPFHQLDAIGPAGSINASATDMLKWVELQLGDGQYKGQHFVSSGQLELMHKPQMLMSQPLIANPAVSHPAYGLGWFTYDYGGLTVVEHGGNIDGFSALVFMVPDESLGLVALTNKNGTPLNYVLAYTITDILLERDEQDWYELVFGDKEEDEQEDDNKDNKEEAKTTPPLHPLEDYVGTYQHPGYGDIIISQQDKQLVATYYHFSGKMEHQQYDTFKGKTEGEDIVLDVRFVTDRNGQIEALYSFLDASVPEIRFAKQPGEKLSDPDFLETLTGTYVLDNSIEIKISLEGTKLKADIVGQPTYTLEPHQGTSFKLNSLQGFTMEFIMEGDKATALVSHQPNGDFRAKKE